MISLIATVAAIIILLTFILLRRSLRKRYFRHRDRRVQFIRDNWQKILDQEIAIKDWFFQKMDRDIVEDLLLDRIAKAGAAQEMEALQELARSSGLMERRIQQVRNGKNWERRLALIALGRMQLPESIPALSEALHDKRDETVVDAIRGLGQVGTPEAAKAIIRQVTSKPHQCPPQTVQAALSQCLLGNSQLLLQETRIADDNLRPILARALSEVADNRLVGDFMELALDPLAEVRASAARIIAVARPSYALNVLSLLAGDPEWFVRLRAAAAIGELGDIHGVPLLVNALCDRNRFVRLRAASELIGFKGEEERVLQLAMQTEDRYALQALISEFERSGRLPELVNKLASDTPQPAVEAVLNAILENGFVSILSDLLLYHADSRVRARLAQLLAQSGDSSLLEHLAQISAAELAPQEQKSLSWAISHLENCINVRQAIKEAVSA
jgi:HEAT repeat protein